MSSTTRTKKQGRHPLSVTVLGEQVPAQGTLLLLEITKGTYAGMLRVHNTSAEPQLLFASHVARQATHPGRTNYAYPCDQQQASLPLGLLEDGKTPNPHLTFEVLQLPQTFLPGGDREMPEDVRREIEAPGSRHRICDLVAAAPPLPGAAADGRWWKNTLGFNRTRYRRAPDYEVPADKPMHAYFIVHVDEAAEPADLRARVPESEIVYRVPCGHHMVDVVVRRPPSAATDAVVAPLQLQPLPELDAFLAALRCPGLISLLQKLIRHRTRSVSGFPSEEVVRRVVRLLVRNQVAGYFLPHVGATVTAVQAVLKRLPVIMCEDSAYEARTIARLAAAALLAHAMPWWRPGEDFCAWVEETAVRALHAPTTSTYDASRTHAVPSLTNASDCSATFHDQIFLHALRHMGCMAGDANMVSDLIAHPEKRNCVGTPGEPLQQRDEDLFIYADMHVSGNVACFLPSRWFRKIHHTGAPYASVLSRLFHTLSGRNSRRPLPPISAQDEAEARAALRQTHLMLTGQLRIQREPVPTGAIRGQSVLNHTLPLECLAGMMTPHAFKTSKHTKVLVTVAPDLERFIVIPQPSRDARRSRGDIAHAEAFEAEEDLKRVLRESGKRVVHPMAPQFAGQLIRRDEAGQWTIGGVPWSEARKQQHHVGEHVGSAKLRRLLDEQQFTVGARLFAASLLAGFEDVRIPGIGRTGAGTKTALTGYEAQSYAVLAFLASHWPAALQLHASRPFVFTTACFPLRHQLCLLLRAGRSEIPPFPPFAHPEAQLFPGQREALEAMRANRRPCQFLWMPPGHGKTLVVGHWLQQHLDGCAHVFWCTPPSAVHTLMVQVRETMGWDPILLAPTKSIAARYSRSQVLRTGTGLRRGVVYIVRHDDLRRMKTQLALAMHRSAFVFDEAHLAMARGTQRTAAALHLARLARATVALTGTPIVDNKGYGLMEWIRCCVPFPVSLKNFWMAMNFLVSNFEGNRDLRIVDLPDAMACGTPQEEQWLREHFPRRPPWNGLACDEPTRETWREVHRRSQVVATRHLVSLAHYYATQGRNPQTGLPLGATTYREAHCALLSREETAAAASRTISSELMQVLESGSGGATTAAAQAPALRASWHNVLLVAADATHAVEMIHMLLQRGIPASDVLMLGGQRPAQLAQTVAHASAVHLTEERVLEVEAMPPGEERTPAQRLCAPYRIVVLPISAGVGLSLTWCTLMLTAKYPVNFARVEQVRGRITRLDSQRRERAFLTVLAGSTIITQRYQREAESMQRALRGASSSSARRPRKRARTST